LQKGILVPLENRLGFHQFRDKLPSAPHLGQQNPEQPESWMEARARLSLLPDAFCLEGERDYPGMIGKGNADLRDLPLGGT
jgi:hypothetical protein